MEQWEDLLTDNKWVLSIVRNGFKIPFRSVSPLSVVPINLSQSSSPLLREEIAELLKKLGVERVWNLGTPGFYSRLFLEPKKNGKLCPVIDLSLLNHYIHKQHFKMETVKSIRQWIMFNDWALSTDLTDAYLHVPIHPISRKYLRFVYDHRVLQFTALLNHYIHKQHFKMDTIKSVRQWIMFNDWALSIDLMHAYLHIPIHPISRKYLRFVYDHQVFSVHGLIVRNVSKSVGLHKDNECHSNTFTSTCRISLSIPG